MKFWRKPLDVDNFKVPKGEVRVIVERCKGCAFCVEYCPTHILQISKKFNKKGYHPPEIVQTGLCVNCNLCEMICPDFAIFSVAISDDVKAELASEMLASLREFNHPAIAAEVEANVARMGPPALEPLMKCLAGAPREEDRLSAARALALLVPRLGKADRHEVQQHNGNQEQLSHQ